MRDSLFNNLKNLFSLEKNKKQSLSEGNNALVSKVIGSETALDKHHQSEVKAKSEEFVDSRYSKLNALTLKNIHSHQLEAGEMIICSENQHIFCKSQLQKYERVNFTLTNFKLWIKKGNSNVDNFPLGNVDAIKKSIPDPTQDKVFKILVSLKDGRKFKFRIQIQALWTKIYETIEKFAFVKLKQQFFAFRHYEYNHALEKKYQGWKVYHPIQEFERMGLRLMNHFEENPKEYTSDFKILDNSDGGICQTYPEVLVVPSRMSFQALKKCAKFRSRERLPALSFAYEYKQDKFACVYRSSQNKVGLASRSVDDELMLKLIGDPSEEPSKEKKKNCVIYDARGYMAAIGNKLQGKGYETIDYYENCTLEFLNIPNIHSVRQAYNKMLEACYGEDGKFFVAMAESKWYQYIFLILNGSIELSKTLNKGINSLVHCSDGWDRTAQLCSLASIILDPFYRTFKGFYILIEKDWIYFGHQFTLRLGQGLNKPKSQDKSQVFLQYLDCVTQIMHQFPHQFEYNYALVEQVSEQAYSHLYGNFLCNCYREVQKCEVKQKTISLWSKIEEQKAKYINKNYLPTSQKFLHLDTSLRRMRLWKEHFLKHVDEFKSTYSASYIRYSQEHLKSMHKSITEEMKESPILGQL